MSRNQSVFLLLAFISFSLFQVSVQNPSLCLQQESCRDCLDADELCAWCSDNEYFASKQPRCMRKQQMELSDCRSNQILYNKEAKIVTVKDESLHDYDKGSMDTVQISPQKLKLNLRKSRPQEFTMSYRPARNYPLDLYYLMDLTWTMSEHKTKIVGIGEQLGNSLLNLTTNYRLAFGSFADKPIMPFTSLIHTDNPCASVNTTCEPTYAFRHRLNFTSTTKEFTEGVQKSNLTANLDNREGTLEALMQILVCTEAINWNENSRKIVVIATDGAMHFAGDGLLAGIVRPHDKECHLDNRGEYVAALEMDYPSIADVYHQLVKHKVNVIFAVVQDLAQYDQFHLLTQDVTSVGRLDPSSSNILELVETGYKKFAQKVNFVDNAPDYIKLSYTSNCGGTNKCDDITVGEKYEFGINLELLKYPPEDQKSITIRIEESSLNEGLDIEVNFDYGCDCGTEPIEGDSLCNSHGSLRCGECFCDANWLGNQCSCNSQFDGEELNNLCREHLTQDNNETLLAPLCSDHGECFCGKCFCHAGYSGKYCNCQECPIINGKQCGGSSNGYCDCGSCVCKLGWSGEFCECSTDSSTCQPPNSDAFCSERGKCECGNCQCDRGYMGEFCEINSETAENKMCQFFEPCVQCVTKRKLDMICDDIEVHCKSSGIEHIYDFFSELPDSNTSCITRIRHEKEDSLCEFKFSYDFNSDMPSRINIKNDACPPVKYAKYSIIGLFLLTFLLGLLFVVVYKVKITIEDKREWTKFEEQLKSETRMQMESPLYVSPLTTYKVPEMKEFSLNET